MSKESAWGLLSFEDPSARMPFSYWKWFAVETTYHRHNNGIFSALLHQISHTTHASINAQDEIAFSTLSLTL